MDMTCLSNTSPCAAVQQLSCVLFVSVEEEEDEEEDEDEEEEDVSV